LYCNIFQNSKSLRSFIRDTFKRYTKIIENIEPLLEKDYKDLHESIMPFMGKNYEDTTRNQVVNSLKALSQVMCIYFNRKVFLFIEDFDYLIWRDIVILSQEQIEERFELMNDFYEATLVENEFYENSDYSRVFSWLRVDDLSAVIRQSLRDGETKTLRDFRHWVQYQSNNSTVS
jgi:hypothetical protein